MKNLYLRSAVALSCALSLAACGGDDKGTWQVGGTVQNVTVSGLVLQNKGGPDLKVEPNVGTFAFPDLINTDTEYDITVKTPPSNASCDVVNGKGKASIYGVRDVAVVCTLRPHDIKGRIVGLTSGPLVIINGAYRLSIPANATDFNMTRPGADEKTKVGQVGETMAYGLSVLVQPPGLTCRIDNAIGTMGKADIDNILITCN
ncbi:hypothetical protein [Massilia antarctica]|uniref:hypothetical protein n=1 Tax=Massilia antarctica TaxID=2765360 RepID=UPI0006BB922B|nr:hypothetical protein [Massilia sp. H27-R4]MCY0915329.1 hypothetical protein [Massilia sp. H27-R4]CUI05789.1 Uncharacterized conserved protein [Janthinobacterium sp. CG23_2]CUU29575.1 Uncharacterized conserved protein [Janthinobacterium sp. CG23_2]